MKDIEQVIDDLWFTWGESKHGEAEARRLARETLEHFAKSRIDDAMAAVAKEVRSRARKIASDVEHLSDIIYWPKGK
jgi:hypothetical protein